MVCNVYPTILEYRNKTSIMNFYIGGYRSLQKAGLKMEKFQNCTQDPTDQAWSYNESSPQSTVDAYLVQDVNLNRIGKASWPSSTLSVRPILPLQSAFLGTYGYQWKQ